MANVSQIWEKLDGTYTKRLWLSKNISWTQNPTRKMIYGNLFPASYLEKVTVNFNAYDQDYFFK